jgi:hypothetical protein
MDKTKLNFLIDALMFLCMMAIAGLGMLIKYILLSGRDAWVLYGRKVDMLWLGMDRHEWGEVHLYLAFFLLGLLVLHIILHWQMILILFKRLISAPISRIGIAAIFLILSLILIYFPFLITPELNESGPKGRGYGIERSNDNSEDGIYYLG